MLNLAYSLPLYLCSSPTDMRMGFNGLCGIVSNHFKKDPLRDGIFVFVNQQRDRMKILLWDRHSFWLLYTRLEAGRFQMPPSEPDAHPQALAITTEQLMMIIEGIDLGSVKRMKRFMLPQQKH